MNNKENNNALLAESIRKIAYICYNLYTEDGDGGITDLMVDIMHYCDHIKDFNYPDIAVQAIRHHFVETTK